MVLRLITKNHSFYEDIVKILSVWFTELQHNGKEFSRRSFLQYFTKL